MLASGSWYTSSAFWAAAGAVVALTVGALTVVLTSYYRPRGRLVYGLLSTEPLLSAASPTSDLQILYNGQVVDYPQLVVIRLANEGGRDIPSSSFDEARPLILDLNVDIVTILRDASSLESEPLKIEVEGSRLNIGPGLIRRGDEIQLVILARGRGAHLTVQNPLMDVTVRELRRKTPELIPNAEYLRQYSELQPGAAERILRMVEEQRQLEDRVTRARLATRLSIYLLLGFTLLASIAFAIYIGIHEKNFVGVLVVTLSAPLLVAGISVFLTIRERGPLGSRSDSSHE